jgi:thiosulfate/3-mercaptopyruvate sulfurtransferase
MHGDYASIDGFTTDSPLHRYEGGQVPACVNCHEEVTLGEDGIEMHQMHGERLSCQVCHSVSYTSCDGCHVQVNEDNGNPYFSTEGSYLTFFIGKNPLKSEERPYDYVPVRHIPVSPTSYAYYTGSEMANFGALPTWAYATPHNIQRETPQNESCDACHGNPTIFLTADKVAEGELELNQIVIVDEIPLPVAELLAAIPAQPEDHAAFAASLCVSCHQSGGDIPLLPEDHAGYAETSCSTCHPAP